MTQAALLADWEFMAALVEAAGNLVFQLVMNSVRELYLPQADAFTTLVAGRRQLARSSIHALPLRCVGDGDGAAGAIERARRRAGAMIG